MAFHVRRHTVKTMTTFPSAIYIYELTRLCQVSKVYLMIASSSPASSLLMVNYRINTNNKKNCSLVVPRNNRHRSTLAKVKRRSDL